MQVFKRIKFIFCILMLTACQSFTSREGVMQTPRQTDIFGSEGKFRTAMLLPLSGKAEAYGKGLQNAAMLAVEDSNNPALVVEFYDTQATPDGARRAASKALEGGARLILGPLTSDEVSAISPIARSEDVPVIAFTSSSAVLDEGVYTLGLLGGEQINRVIGYAAKEGRKRIAVLVPDTPTGIKEARSAVIAAAQNDASVVKIGFYPPQTVDFAELIKELISFEEISAEINAQKEQLSALAKAGNEKAAQKLKMLKTTYTTGELDFDAVLIPETGNRLKAIVSTFGYYDISYPKVLFMGTSLWENNSLNKETMLYNGVYPVISRVQNEYFNAKYESLFGSRPNLIFSFGYDGVLLASALASKNQDNLEANITSPSGYIGINGAFRLLKDGGNQHSLDIVKVTASGPVVVDPAKDLASKPPYTQMHGSYTVEKPQIFGKDAATAYELLFD